ncbi:MAG: FKBP-type peptidyl-prolyl cis-trans isomerase [Lentisphaeria bacterium]|nr:FKBP-type peptidyl-prolyl cis-trans isomerase [Lentisphaeria bacterium]
MIKPHTIALPILVLFLTACIKNRDDKLMKARMKARADAIKISKKRSAAFHVKKKSESGVITLSSGLQYKVLRSGKGESPSATDRVTCHYEGRHLNGLVFDSSYKRGRATELGVNRVIPGWTEALKRMKIGDKWELYIPYQLAYGERGTRRIPPCSSLIFIIELINYR